MASIALLLLSACSQTSETPAPDAPLDDMVMLRTALKYAQRAVPGLGTHLEGEPTEDRASGVITYADARQIMNNPLSPGTTAYQRKDEPVRIFVFRGDMHVTGPRILEGMTPFPTIIPVQLTVILNAFTGQEMGRSLHTSLPSLKYLLDMARKEILLQMGKECVHGHREADSAFDPRC